MPYLILYKIKSFLHLSYYIQLGEFNKWLLTMISTCVLLQLQTLLGIHNQKSFIANFLLILNLFNVFNADISLSNKQFCNVLNNDARHKCPIAFISEATLTSCLYECSAHTVLSESKLHGISTWRSLLAEGW